MLPRTRRAARLAGALLFIAVAARAADGASGTPANIDGDIDPLPSVITFAKANAIPISGIFVQDSKSPAGPGDRITYIVGLYDKTGLREWLIDLSEVELSPANRAKPPPRMGYVYTGTGGKFTMQSDWAEEHVRIAGPFLGGGADHGVISDKASRFLVHQGFLRFGLNQTAAYLLKVKATAKSGHYTEQLMLARYQPFPQDTITAGEAQARAAGIAPGQDEGFANSLPSLVEFFRIAERTPGVRDIILQVLSKPSFASVLFRGGNLDVSFSLEPFNTVEISPRGQFIPTPIYGLPFDFVLNGHTSLNCLMVVTEPRAPLEACAGILQLIAVSPTDRSKYLNLRLLSATRGTASRSMWSD